jgi:hypothetical protein
MEEIMNPKLECIKRLLNKTNCFVEISEWLIELKILEQSSLKLKTRPDERAILILDALTKAEEKEVFQLLYFEWTILPVESIKLTCVTNKESKEFKYKL